MKYIKQTKIHSETVKGNCMAACLASVLDLEIGDVPQFEEISNPDHWNLELIKWLDSIGYYINAEYVFKYTDGDKKVYEMPEGLLVVAGKSPRFDLLHCVVYENGGMIHDPHPDNTGILDVLDYWQLYKKEDNKAGKWYGFEYKELSDLVKENKI
jgi:hypothetical protein